MAVFVLAGDGLQAFASVHDVLGQVEAIDVDEGEYRAAWLHDGTVLRLRAPEGPEGPVVVERTGETDVPGLLAAVRAAGGPGDLDALLDHVDEQLRWEWAHRWPRRPGWLSRRLHGDGPRRATLY